MDVIIYHNPDCGTSRNVLAMIRNSGAPRWEISTVTLSGIFSIFRGGSSKSA